MELAATDHPHVLVVTGMSGAGRSSAAKILEDIGYTMPSLSVGDLIHWDHVTYRVAGSGFEKLTESSDYAMALTAYTLKTMSGPARADVERGI